MNALFTGLLLICSLALFAQPRLRSATLTDRTDKAKPGFIRFYDWDEQPKFIEFSIDSAGSMQAIPLRNIQKIAINDGPVYESLYLKIPYYAKDPLRPGDPLLDRIDSTYYLSELLLDSQAIKLYSVMDANKTMRFVVAKYDSLVVLDDVHVRMVKGDLIYDYHSPVFRKTLTDVLYECPTLNTANTTYTERSLIDAVKAYLSFCRIDSKVLLEQKKQSKPILSAGAFGDLGRGDNDWAVHYGVSVQVLLPRQFHNLFALFNLGTTKQMMNGGVSNLLLGLYGGRYIGRRAWQGRVYTGLSTFGLLDTGVGVSYRKRISADVRYALLSNVLGSLYDSNVKARPFFTLSAHLPISR